LGLLTNTVLSADNDLLISLLISSPVLLPLPASKDARVNKSPVQFGTLLPGPTEPCAELSA
jgi:hypothetical protein